MITPFQDNFWSNDDKGFNVLLERLKSAKKSSASLCDMLTQKAILDEEYGKRLIKIAKQWAPITDAGTMPDLMNSVGIQYENIGMAFLQSANSAREQIIKPFLEFMNNQRNAKKLQKAVVEKSYKARMLQQQVLLKSKEKYEARCKEKDALINSKPSNAGKELEKFEVKYKKACAVAESCDNEYISAVMKYKAFHVKWVNDMTIACQEIQAMEQTRILKVTEFLQLACANETIFLQEKSNSVEKIRSCASSVNVDKDLNDFVQNSGTGKEIPKTIDYVNYYTGQSTIPPDSPSIDLKFDSRVSTPGISDSSDDESSAPKPLSVPKLQEIQEIASFDTQVIFKVKVLFDYEPQAPEELALKTGDIINVCDLTDDPWWMGQIDNRNGLFPSNYVEKC